MRPPWLVLSMVVSLALVPTAHASTVSYSPGGEGAGRARVDVIGDAGSNALEVVVLGGTTVVRDAAADLQAGPGCSKLGDGSVACGVGTTTIRAGGGNDRVSWSGTTARAFGGHGDDALSGGGEVRGGPGADVISGADSGDELSGGPGRDRVSGGAGDDILFDIVDPRRDEAAPGEAEPQADVLDGGAGVDWLYLQTRRQPLFVDLTASPQRAGARGEGNAVANIELATGGRGDDRLRLGPVRREFRQEEENGRVPLNLLFLNAGSGNDRVTLEGPLRIGVDGHRGDDVIRGSAGADELLGDEGDDFIDGRGGADDISDHNGRDVLFGGAGNDRIEAEDTFGLRRDRDRVDCGRGRDIAEVDRRQDRWRRCERVRNRDSRA